MKIREMANDHLLRAYEGGVKSGFIGSIEPFRREVERRMSLAGQKFISPQTEETKLLTPDELDRLLRYPPGRSERLARRGKLPHVMLPGGDVRFDSEVVKRLLADSARAVEGEAHNGR